MENLLEKLGLGKLNKNALPVEISELKKFEKSLKVSLPKDYRDFLKEYGNNTMTFYRSVCYQPRKKSPLADKDGYDGFDLFYGLEKDGYDLNEMLKTYKGRIPDSFIPIAEAPGGDQILLGIKKDSQYGKIYFWDHESRGTNEDDIYLIADSFNDFIKSFELDE